MTRMYLAMARQLLVASEEHGSWRADARLEGLQPVSLAADPLSPGRIYCGTWGRGLWRREDAGASWRPVGDPVADWTLSGFGDGIPHPHVTAVAVSPTEGTGGLGALPLRGRRRDLAGARGTQGAAVGARVELPAEAPHKPRALDLP